MPFRVGLGSDSHRFEEKEGKELVLAGKVIEGEKGLKAHSDGDAVVHAIFNAVSSGLGGRSIGFYHSDKDQRKEGIASHKYLETVKKMLKEKQYAINNLAVIIEGKKPKIEAHVEEMKKNLARFLEIEPEKISITATSGEGLTEFGKGKGIQVYAVVGLIHEKARKVFFF